MRLRITENKSVGQFSRHAPSVRVFVDGDFHYGYWVPEDELAALLTSEQKTIYLESDSADLDVQPWVAQVIINIGKTTYGKKTVWNGSLEEIALETAKEVWSEMGNPFGELNAKSVIQFLESAMQKAESASGSPNLTLRLHALEKELKSIRESAQKDAELGAKVRMLVNGGAFDLTS